VSRILILFVALVLAFTLVGRARSAEPARAASQYAESYLSVIKGGPPVTTKVPGRDGVWQLSLVGGTVEMSPAAEVAPKPVGIRRGPVAEWPLRAKVRRQDVLDRIRPRHAHRGKRHRISGRWWRDRRNRGQVDHRPEKRPNPRTTRPTLRPGGRHARPTTAPDGRRRAPTGGR
jgi:hypothetical protein